MRNRLLDSLAYTLAVIAKGPGLRSCAGVLLTMLLILLVLWLRS